MPPSRLFALLPLLLAAACGDSRVVAPDPEGDFSTEADTLPILPAGIVSAPIRLDLDGARALLESTVPRRFGDLARPQRADSGSRMSFAYEVEREPFAVRFAGDTVLLSATIHYQGRGWYDPPIGPTVHGTCGTGEGRPRARLAVRVVASLTPAWKLRTRTVLDSVTPLTDTERDQCEVTFAKINVTGRVISAAEGALRRVLPQVDRMLGRLDVRGGIAGIWAELQEPIRITDSLWLLFRPEAVHLGTVRGSREFVVGQVGIAASPRILTGPRPPSSVRPLPPLGPAVRAEDFTMLVEGLIDYGVLSASLVRQLAGRELSAAGRRFTVKALQVRGIGRGRVALGVDFEGSASGRVWFLGTPSHDGITGMIAVPDLEVDASSAGLLVRGLAWLKGDEIRAFLRDNARVPAAELLDPLRDLAQREMNRELAQGVRLVAELTAAAPAGIHPRQRGLILRAQVTGSARLEIGAAVFAPAPRPATRGAGGGTGAARPAPPPGAP